MFFVRFLFFFFCFLSFFVLCFMYIGTIYIIHNNNNNTLVPVSTLHRMVTQWQWWLWTDDPDQLAYSVRGVGICLILF